MTHRAHRFHHPLSPSIQDIGRRQEAYVLAAAFEGEPGGGEITASLRDRRAAVAAAERAAAANDGGAGAGDKPWWQF